LPPVERSSGPAEVAIHAMADHRKLLILPTLAELGQGREDNLYVRGVAWEDRLFVLPAQQRLITLATGQDRLFVRTLDRLGQLDAADVDYLFVASLPPRRVAPGATYRYPMRVLSRRGHVECKLVSGPEGMTLDKDLALTWTPGAKPREAETGVIIAIRDASGQEFFHTFTIEVESE